MRYYFSKIIGTGTEDDPFRPAFANYNVTWSGVDARRDIFASAGWMLVKSDPSDTDHLLITSDPDITYLPLEDSNGNVLPLTATVSEVNNIQNVKTYLEAHHIPTQGITGADTIRHALKVIFRRFLIRHILSANDFVESLDLTVGDIPLQKRLTLASKLAARGIDTSGLTLSTTIRDGLNLLINQNNTWLKTEYDD